jgi:hypothetical protein
MCMLPQSTSTSGFNIDMYIRGKFGSKLAMNGLLLTFADSFNTNQ